MASLPLITLVIVFIAICLRPWFFRKISMGLILTAGAVVVLMTRSIHLRAAWQALDWNLLGFLLGAFIIAEHLEESGYLQHLSTRFLGHARTVNQLLFSIFGVMGIASAILMNDTLAIIATPLLITMAKQNRLPSTPLLLALAFAVTIGSVMSPIGNPQNVLIANQAKFTYPFVTFLRGLALPTFINLFMGYGFVRYAYRHQLPNQPIKHFSILKTMTFEARLSQISLILLVALIVLKTVLLRIGNVSLPFAWLSISASLPIILCSRTRGQVLKKMDWGTLLFFVALFILMKSVWLSGALQEPLNHYSSLLTHTAFILLISSVASQFVSNVPLVALYLPLLMHHAASVQSYLALAAGSTIAGNFTLLGAASNIIILQRAERGGEPGFTMKEFMRVGVWLGLINLVVYGIFLFSP